MFQKVKQIKTKLLIGIMPTVLVSFLALTLLIGYNTQQVLQEESTLKLESQVSLAKSTISTKLIAHQKLPVGLAKTVEATGITPESKKALIQLVQKMPLTNEDSLGTGIFMADQYDGQYFGPYAYKTGSTITYTEDYFVDNTKEGWYTIGNTTQSVAWSDPYFDAVSGITMVTATSPIKDANGKWNGVATGDLDFTNIQKIISEIKVGKAGYAILVTQEGKYLSNGQTVIKADDKGNFPLITEDPNPSLAALGKEVLANKEGVSSFDIDGAKQLTYYSVMPETGWIVLLTIPEAEITAPLMGIIRTIVIISSFTIVLLLFLVNFISRRITKPLSPLKTDIEAIANGDLTRTIAVRSQDEIGQISISINHMVNQLSSTMRDVLDNSSLLAATAEELEASASQNGQAVEQVAVAATTISTSNMEIASVSQSLEKLIDYVSELSDKIESQMTGITDSLDETDQRSRGSEKAVGLLVSSMTEVSNNTKQLATVMSQLSHHGAQINTIAETIQGISSQTNLLALNASIEAARAGEAGRGFSVVADEIRKLAEQSATSANSISEIISEVGKTTQAASESTLIVVNSIQTGQGSLAEVKAAFESITQSVSDINHLVKTTDEMTKNIRMNASTASKSASHLSKLTDESAEETTSIAAATQEQLASVEEQTAATTSLSNMAVTLHDKVSVFKV